MTIYKVFDKFAYQPQILKSFWFLHCIWLIFHWNTFLNASKQTSLYFLFLWTWTGGFIQAVSYNSIISVMSLNLLNCFLLFSSWPFLDKIRAVFDSCWFFFLLTFFVVLKNTDFDAKNKHFRFNVFTNDFLYFLHGFLKYLPVRLY